MNRKLWGITILVGVLGIAVVSFGIGVELATGTQVGYILVSSGALALGAGGTNYAKFLRRAV